MRCLLTLLCLFVASCSEPPKDRTFAPDSSELQVTFPKTPKITTITGVGGLFSEPAQLTRATVEQSRSWFLQADFIEISPTVVEGLTEKQLIDYGLGYARKSGLQNPEVSIEQMPFGRCLVVRAGKEVEGFPVTYLSKMCFANHTVMTLYVGGNASTFPPAAAPAFLNSLKLR